MLWVTHFLSELLRGMHDESGRERESGIISVLRSMESRDVRRRLTALAGPQC